MVKCDSDTVLRGRRRENELSADACSEKKI